MKPVSSLYKMHFMLRILCFYQIKAHRGGIFSYALLRNNKMKKTPTIVGRSLKQIYLPCIFDLAQPRE